MILITALFTLKMSKLDKMVSPEEITFRMILSVSFLIGGTFWMILSVFVSFVPFMWGLATAVSGLVLAIADALFD